jgi:hypothetical protein
MSDEEKKPLKIVFAEGCFDVVAEGMTQEEIDAFKAEIEAKFASVPDGATEEEAAEFLGARRLDEEDYEKLADALDGLTRRQ